MLTIPKEFSFFQEHPRVDYLWEDTSCEIVFFYKVLKLVLEDPLADSFHFFVLNEEPLPFTNKKVIAIQVGLEDHRIPKYTEDVGLVFSTYPPTGKIPSNLKGIPLGYNGDLPDMDLMRFEQRPITAFFSGQNSHDRWKIGEAVERLKGTADFAAQEIDVHYSEKFRTGYSPAQYADKLIQSKIAFVPAGSFSPITFRFFEAARAGNIILSCKLPDTWYFESFPGIEVSDWDELDTVLKKLINDPALMKKMHLETVDYYNKYCSEEAVANYMLDEIRKIV